MKENTSYSQINGVESTRSLANKHTMKSLLVNSSEHLFERERTIARQLFNETSFVVLGPVDGNTLNEQLEFSFYVKRLRLLTAWKS